MIKNNFNLKKYYKYLYCLPLILPNNKWKILADFFFNCFVIYRMFVVTIKLTFFFDNIYGCINMIDIRIVAFINICYFFDVVLNFNTGYYNKGIIIKDRKKIAINYLKGDFLKNTLA